MKKTLQFLLTLGLLLSASAISAEVTFKFSAHSMEKGPVKSKIEQTLSALLTEFDRAASQNRPLNLDNLDIDPTAQNRLTFLWDEMTHMQSTTDFYVSPAINDVQGFEVRGIKVEMLSDDGLYDGARYRELCFVFNKQGKMTKFIPIEDKYESMMDILNSGLPVEDLERRHELLKFVDDFRWYYNEKNIQAISDIFSDDALIITGTVNKRKENLGNGEMKTVSKVDYKRQTKAEYISKLRSVFKNNYKIDVKFDSIQVAKSSTHEGFYGVTLFQRWKADRYNDEGWLFLYWDFTKDPPQILVRTWQEEAAAREDGIFNMNDFEVY